MNSLRVPDLASISDASSEITGGLATGVVDSYQLSGDASWEIDIVGGRRSAVDANAATAGAREADLQHVVVTLAADVGSTYIRLRAQQERLGVARDNERVQADTHELVQRDGIREMAKRDVPQDDAVQ